MTPDKSVDKLVERHLRVEAGAAQWEEFDEAQQKAYVRIAGMIAEAIGDMPPLDESASSSDTVRRTRSAFLTGGRGTGKTTVLETFRRDSRPRIASKDVVKERPELDEESRTRQLRLARERQDLLTRIRGRVVWLETLDMEPLPPETNLLASILVRLEDAARAYGVDSGPATRKPRGLVEPSSEYHSALLDLQRLQTDVALAWEGNLLERRGSMDPDAFAVEVMRVERARLSLNAKFADTLRKLAAHVFRGHDVDNVLFVLPVDDFDLNPPICLDLLRVLRLISIPRLFTLVLGDLNVASTVLSLKLSNDLGSLARRLQSDMLAVLPGTVASLAGDVAANAIRKLLPPGQRIELSPMRLPEAMNFRPLGSTDTAPYLHELFADCPVHLGWELPPVPDAQPTALELQDGRSSLRQVLLAPPLTVLAAEQRKPRTAAGDSPPSPTRALPRTVADGAVYSGTRFVQAPPRLVADTWLEIHKITTSGAEIFEPLLTYFAGACRAALRETAVFAPHERDDVERAVSRTIAGSWTLRTLPLSLRTDTAPRRPIEITLPDRRDRRSAARSRTRQAVRPSTSPASLPVHILTADSLGWQMAVYGAGRTTLPETPPPGLGPARNRRPGRLLSDNAVHALIMYHDLLAFGPGEASFESPLLTAANLEIDWAATEWKLPSPVRFDWPAPPSTTFFDLDRFRATWSVVIRHPEIVEDTGHERIVERLAFAWLSLGTAVVTKDTAVLMTPRGQELPWRELINRLEHVAGKARARRSLKAGRYVEWLRRVAELLAPEMGLPTQVTDRFVRIPATLSLVWRNNRVAVRQRRAERLQQLFRVDHALAEGVRAYSLATSDFAPERSEVERAPASAPWEQ